MFCMFNFSPFLACVKTNVLFIYLALYLSKRVRLRLELSDQKDYFFMPLSGNSKEK